VGSHNRTDTSLTPSEYEDEIAAHTRTTVGELTDDYRQLHAIRLNLPDGHSAYWTVPRAAGQWRLPRDNQGLAHSNELTMLPMRNEWYKPNAYLAVLPQPMVMHENLTALLERYAASHFRHFPKENTLARREYGVPMLIGRFDVIVDRSGNIQICELDDVCSLWPAMPQMNPIAETYIRALEDQMNLPIYTAELFQYTHGPSGASPQVRRENDDGTEQVAYIPRSEPISLAIQQQNGLEWRDSRKVSDHDHSYYQGLLQRFYAHNEDHWRGDVNEAWLLKGKRFGLDEVALSVRAYRDMAGFDEHMDRYGSRSITMAWNRDSKWPLVADKLGVLAANLDVAVKFGQSWQLTHPDELLVFKTLHGARTEGTAIYSSKGTKLKGVASAGQIARKFGAAANQPIVIQPYKEPDNLEQAGVQFLGSAADESTAGMYSDRGRIRSLDHIGPYPGARVLAGLEDKFFVVMRSFVVYLPEEGRIRHIGGMWQATDGRIVHGGAHSIAGPLYADGLLGHPSAARTRSLEQAELMLRQYSRVLGSPLGVTV
jgi:hypothetical protein